MVEEIKGALGWGLTNSPCYGHDSKGHRGLEGRFGPAQQVGGGPGFERGSLIQGHLPLPSWASALHASPWRSQQHCKWSCMLLDFRPTQECSGKMKWFVHSYSEDMAPGQPGLRVHCCGPPQARRGGSIVSPTAGKTWTAGETFRFTVSPVGDPRLVQPPLKSSLPELGEGLWPSEGLPTSAGASFPPPWKQRTGFPPPSLCLGFVLFFFFFLT